MCRILPILPVLAAAGLPLEVRADKLQYVNSPAVILTAQTANAAGIDEINVWVSTDGGKAWEPANVDDNHGRAARFDAARDGKYSFYMILENEAGRSADPPRAGTQPHVTVIVDTAPPTMQIHKASILLPANGPPVIRLSASLVEENLGKDGLRVFYQTKQGDQWTDGGVVTFVDGIVDWQPPAEAKIEPRLDICLIATDLAGNRARDEIRGVTCPAPAAAKNPDCLPPKRVPLAETDIGTLPPTEPLSVAPVPAITLEDHRSPPTEDDPGEDAQPFLAAMDRARRLRELASEYSAQGQFPLAGARLREALELSPDDPDLLVDLGSVSYCTHQNDEACRRFRAALDIFPDHVGALEGLALVAATQNRYPEALENLQHLLRLSPDSGKHWLRYGDMEHMLGNAAEARDAWEKVLELDAADKTVLEKASRRLKLFGQQEP